MTECGPGQVAVYRNVWPNQLFAGAPGHARSVESLLDRLPEGVHPHSSVYLLIKRVVTDRAACAILLGNENREE